MKHNSSKYSISNKVIERSKSLNKQKISFSIITVCYNSGQTIRRTIKSVVKQTYENYEYLVIDGNSSDNTLNIIKEYQAEVDFCISEKDGGIYDAMNKGINFAKGDYILMLNSDDYLFEERTLEKIVNGIGKNYLPPVIYCDTIKEDKDKRKTVRAKKALTLSDFHAMPVFHNSTFVKRDIYDKYQKYNLNYDLAADYEFFLRLFKQGIQFEKRDIVTTVFSTGGRSEVNLDAWLEMRKAMKSHSITGLYVSAKYYMKLLRASVSILYKQYIR